MIRKNDIRILIHSRQDGSFSVENYSKGIEVKTFDHSSLIKYLIDEILQQPRLQKNEGGTASFPPKHFEQKRNIVDIFGNPKTLSCECKNEWQSDWMCLVHGLTSSFGKVWGICKGEEDDAEKKI
jgi:hypothetical protein